MIEDKLTPEQRLRLECVAQANIAMTRETISTVDDIIKKAMKFEAYVRGDESK